MPYQPFGTDPAVAAQVKKVLEQYSQNSSNRSLLTALQPWFDKAAANKQAQTPQGVGMTGAMSELPDNSAGAGGILGVLQGL